MMAAVTAETGKGTYTMFKLPTNKTEADYKMLDDATLNDAIKTMFSLLTNEQKNTVLTNSDGARVTVIEFLESAGITTLIHL